jgi:hypothetical protein
MLHHITGHRHYSELPDFSDTQVHIFHAGRELLLAAVGVLKFCRTYVERTSNEKPHPNLIKLFSKAIMIAGELASSMKKGSPMKEAALKMTRPFCDTMERELSARRTRTPSTRKIAPITKKKKLRKKRK